jgi:hypothetical protein
MRYQHFRQLGMFIGSGHIEAGCKAIVVQRTKQSGMHWTTAGAAGHRPALPARQRPMGRALDRPRCQPGRQSDRPGNSDPLAAVTSKIISNKADVQPRGFCDAINVSGLGEDGGRAYL